MTTSPAPARVACVVEDQDECFTRVFTLATSLRNLGGVTASLPMHVLFLGSMDGVFSVPLAASGVTSSVVDRWPGDAPGTATLRALEAPGLDSNGVLIALDHDVVVLRDLSGAISSSAVRAVPAWSSPLRPARWHQLLGDMGMEPRTGPWATLGTNERVPVPYLDSAVLFVPAAMVGALHEAWRSHLERLSTGGYGLSAGELAAVDQVALALALAETGLPVEPLGREWAFRPDLGPASGATAALGAVRILHEHHWAGAGEFPTPLLHPALAGDIGRLNAITAARRSVTARRDHGESLKVVAERLSKMVAQAGRAMAARAGG